MTKIAEISDRAACAAWCPLQAHPNVVALGTKDSGGGGFDDTGGELEVYDLWSSNITSGADDNDKVGSTQPKLLGSIKTGARFASVAWTPYTRNGKYPMGLLAGGMVDGTIYIWDPSLVIAAFSQNQTAQAELAACLVHTVQAPPASSNSSFGAMQFNPLEPHQLAAGAANGHVSIIDISADKASVQEPTTVASQFQTSEIKAVAWNPQVSHIVASAAADGSVVVWDYKSRKAWCELRAAHAAAAVNDVCWNPSQGLHLLTCSGDDRDAVLKVWDLGASTSMPLTTLTGHAAGILSASWCPHDETLLLTTAKDNRTFLWDLQTLRPVAELSNEAAEAELQQKQQQQTQQAHPTNVFAAAGAGAGGGLSDQRHMRYAVAWSPWKRGVVLTCSLDRKVEAHSVLTLATKSGRPPAWMRPASSVSCSFGGLVVSCGSQDKVVSLRTVCEQPEFAETSQRLETELKSQTIVDFCRFRHVTAARNKTEADMWGFMQVLFDANARQALLQHLGYDADSIASTVAARYPHVATTTEHGESSVNGSSNKSTTGLPKPPSMKTASSMLAKSTFDQAAEDSVKQALLVGNFEAAVDVCLATGNWADALVLASCGGPDLWQVVQTRFFASETAQRPYLNIVSAVIRSQLSDLATSPDIATKWSETLAIFSTYGASEEFPQLCVALGESLEEAGDPASATLCYMCALNLDHTVRFWKSQLAEASRQKGEGTSDVLALHEFVTKVSVFLEAVGPSAILSEDIATLFADYAEVLAQQGLLVTAAKYARKGTSIESQMLRDRLYRSRASASCYASLGTAPEFPYRMSAVEPSRGPTVVKNASYAQHQPDAIDLNKPQPKTTYEQRQQSSIYGRQHERRQTSSGAPVPAAVIELPSGWMELHDPNSRLPYYANQATGETTWDRPQAIPSTNSQTVPQQTYASVPASQEPVMDSSRHSTRSQTSVTSGVSTLRPKPSVVSKYGDGFVTSASHPELADQYGNIGTSNPYSGVNRPGTAAAVAATAQSAVAPISDTLNIETLEVSPEFAHIKDTLLACVNALKDYPLSPADKRQLAEAEKGVAILVKKIVRYDIDEETVSKVSFMIGALANGDYPAATATNTALVNSDWRDHKDWLKGMKSLLALASKKFARQ